MSLLSAQLTFEPLSWPLPAVLTAAGALAWEWLRWGRRHGAPQSPRRLALAVPAAVATGALAAWLLWREPRWSLPVLAVLAVLWSTRGYRRTTAGVRGAMKALLLTLRVAVILLVLLIAARPVLEHRYRRIVREGLALLVDTSGSMARADAPPVYLRPAGATAPAIGPRISRLASVEQALFAQQARLDELAQRYDLRIYGFDGQLAPVRPADLRADGPVTAIGDCMQQALDRFLTGGVESAGIVVISDGANNTVDLVEPLQQARSLAARGVSLWTVGVGSENADQVAALNVRNLSSPDRIDAADRLDFSAQIEALGLAGQTVTVEATLGQRLVATRQLAFTGGAERQTVRFSTVPTQTGFHRLSVTVRPPELPDRPLLGQPSAGKLVHVLSRHVRVLYIEGRRRYENKFVAQALDGGRFKLTRWLLSEPGGQNPWGADDEQAWNAYHVILLGDVPAERFSPRQIEWMARMVDQGGRGLAMLGGRESFAAGGWAGTPLADVLPVDLPSSAGELPGPLRVLPNPGALETELMQIDPGGQHEVAWKSLRALDGANVLGRPKPAAQVLASDEQGRALLVAQKYGAGRSLAVAFDTTWQWVLSPDETAGLQQRFWRQAVLWLSSPMPNVWVTTDRTSYDARRLAGAAASIEVTAGVEDASGNPLRDVPVQVVLLGPDGAGTSVPLRPSGELRTGTLAALRPGRYTLTLEAQAPAQQGQTPRTLRAEHAFEVVAVDLEELDLVANLELLRRMGQAAEPAAGGYRDLARLDAVLEHFLTGRNLRYDDGVHADPLVDRHRWRLLAAILALLSIEWALRKKAGLV